MAFLENANNYKNTILEILNKIVSKNKTENII